MRLAKRALVVILALSLIALPAMAYQAGGSEYVKGRIAGERDAQGNSMWILAGCLLGVIGVLLAYLIEPEVPSAALVGKSPEYVQGYIDGYKAKARQKNAIYALYGLGIAVVVYVIIVAVAGASSS